MILLGTAFFVLILAILTVLTLRKPHLALVGVLSMFGLEQLGQLYIPFLRTHGAFTNIYILLLLGVAVALTFRAGSLSSRFTYSNAKVRTFSIALYLYAFLSLTWGPEIAQLNWSSTWPYLVANMVLAPLVISRIEDLEEVQKVFIWLCGSLVLFLAVVPEWAGRSPIVAGTDEGLGVPLSMAQMSGYLLITTIVHFKKSYLSVLWLSVVLVGALVVAVKTGSRGQLIFSIVGFALVAPLIWRKFSVKNTLQLAVVVAFVATLSVYIMGQTGAASSRWQAGTMMSDLATRFGHAEVLLGEWINSPSAVMFGLGNSASFADDLLGGYPHMVPLEVLGEEGVIGFLLFISIVVLSVRQASRFRSVTILSTDVKKVYAASFGCFLFTLLLSFKQGSLLNSSVIFLFAVLSEKYFYLIKRGAYQYHTSVVLGQKAVPEPGKGENLSSRRSLYPPSAM